jgi:transcriptional regulator with XRE-family HTH domain
MAATVPKHRAIILSEKLCSQLAQVAREWREEQGLSQNKEAEAGALSCQMIGYVEKQMRTPSIDVYCRMAFGMGRKLSDLVAEAEKRVGIK